MHFSILTLNAISPKGLATFDARRYHVGDHETAPMAILVRSADLHTYPLPSSVEVIARAGVGVNTIPVTQCTAAGIPVLNTPGANANAVKELVIAGMLMASRNLPHALEFTRSLKGDDEQITHQVEHHKKSFSGTELPGKTLGVIGLGHIGVKVANAALELGMRVIGFDNSISVQNAWNLSADVIQAHSLAEITQHADFISLHIPLLPDTTHLINQNLLASMRPGVVILNFAREGIVDVNAMQRALQQHQVRYYVCDFPCADLAGNPQVIALPHLGASTAEAEENCAIMAAEQVQKYLEQGTIKNSVNFPNVTLPRSTGHRLTVANQNVPNIIAQLTSTLSKRQMNIIDMINKSRDTIAYNILDVDRPVEADVLREIRAIEGVVRARAL